MTKVFIDGSAGTTGLRIYERLCSRDDLKLITLPDELRKDKDARIQAFNSADVAFLCLPDVAAKEVAEFDLNKNLVLIDTSTAHRTNPLWEYGMPELYGRRKKIKDSKRIANPGCHASGFVALVEPLVRNKLISPNAMLTAFSITGYSGGGKQMINAYESKDRPYGYGAPRQYALAQQHKHLGEMSKITGLENPPVFCPVVADFYSGMEVTVTLFKKDLKGTIEDVKNVYKNYYTTKLIHFDKNADEDGFLSANAYSGRDDMGISVFGNEDRIILVARFDNLGKGASGSAIQNMNIILGIDETKGLVL